MNLENIKESIKNKYEEGDIYNLELFLNSKIFRFNKLKKYNESLELLIYAYNEIPDDTATKNPNYIIKLNDHYLEIIKNIENKKPSDEELTLLFLKNKVTAFSKNKFLFFININKEFFDNKNFKIFNFLITETITNNEFEIGQKLLLELPYNDINKILYNKFFNDYFSKINNNELELCIFRFLLYLILYTKDFNSCIRFYDNYKTHNNFKDSNLNRLSFYLIKTIIEKNKDAFEALIDKFNNDIKIDDNIVQLIGNIKKKYFENSGGLMGMLGSLFK